MREALARVCMPAQTPSLAQCRSRPNATTAPAAKEIGTSMCNAGLLPATISRCSSPTCIVHSFSLHRALSLCGALFSRWTGL